MKLKCKTIIIASLCFVFALPFAVKTQTSVSNHIVDAEKKVAIEYLNIDKQICVADNLETVQDDVGLKYADKFTIQIQFEYEPYSEELYRKIATGNEPYEECSKQYHSTHNQDFYKKLGKFDGEVFISEYTPFVFMTFANEKTMQKAYDYAVTLAGNDFVNSIRLYATDTYMAEVDTMEVGYTYETDTDISTTATQAAFTWHQYENYPVGTNYSGYGIKIGLLDTGIFDTSHSNFSNTHVETVYDTYTANDASAGQHPTIVASVLGGKYGIAPNADIYYVDVNSDTGYIGIERLINKGVKIVNMSISSNSCLNNGNYDTSAEIYLDYIYNSTKVIMVAAAGNTLNIEGSGGYVVFPALCANVISVGSVDNSGIPSDFSSYKIKNDVNSAPDLVAVGSSRSIVGVGIYSGTSFSAPAVSGAIALYFSKNGVKNLPTTLAVLSATADSSKINYSAQTVQMLDKNGDYYTGNVITCTNYFKENGTYERTGAGLLDITALLNYSHYLINYEITFLSNSVVELKSIYVEAGDSIVASVAWQRNATISNGTYASEPLAGMWLFLHDSGGNLMSYTVSNDGNVVRLTYKATVAGVYTIGIQPRKNYKSLHNINYAYVIT